MQAIDTLFFFVEKHRRVLVRIKTEVRFPKTSSKRPWLQWPLDRSLRKKFAAAAAETNNEYSAI